MTTPQMERILLQLKWTLTCERTQPADRILLAMLQINNALAMLEQPCILCVGHVESDSRKIVIVEAK